jgi:hypothetical protein
MIYTNYCVGNLTQWFRFNLKNMFFYPKRQGAFANRICGTTVGAGASIAGHSDLREEYFVPATIFVPNLVGSSHGGIGGGSQLPVGFGGGHLV